MPLRLGSESNVVARKRKQPEARWLLEIVQLGVRLEERLRRRLESAAYQSSQSMNAEIVERLKRSFQSDEDKISLIARAIIDTYPDIANRIEELSAEATLWRDVQSELDPDMRDMRSPPDDNEKKNERPHPRTVTRPLGHRH